MWHLNATDAGIYRRVHGLVERGGAVRVLRAASGPNDHLVIELMPAGG